MSIYIYIYNLLRPVFFSFSAFLRSRVCTQEYYYYYYYYLYYYCCVYILERGILTFFSIFFSLFLLLLLLYSFISPPPPPYTHILLYRYYIYVHRIRHNIYPADYQFISHVEYTRNNNLTRPVDPCYDDDDDDDCVLKILLEIYIFFIFFFLF